MAIETTEQARNSDAQPAAATTSRHEEHQYLDLIRNIITNGQVRPDRTGTGTIAMFAPPALRFSLANGALPLLTTKRVFLRGVVEELLWFVRGSTDGKLLAEKDIHIWAGNGSREYLDKVGLGHRREGDLGPVYGFQWRHFGAEYKTCEDDYTGQGVDQLAQVIDKIKYNPTDRRIIMSAWNPKGMSFVSIVIAQCSHTSSTCRPTINGPPTMPHVLPILRHPPTPTNRIQSVTETAPLMPDVPTFMRPRPRRPVQHRVLLPTHTHDRTHDRHGAARVHPSNGRRACLSGPCRAASGPVGTGAEGVSDVEVEEE